MSGEWIEHDGRGMPVDADVVVCIRVRGGEETPERWNTKAREWNWRWVDKRSGAAYRSGDILSYRIVEA